ncbi:hypothetical protein CIK68_17880 [Brachybacterium alimentarium]|nr:hypothetical protein CIK68_17880 [Brachybacterium alimentarium]
MEREVVAIQPEERVHMPSELQKPGVRGEFLVRRRIPIDGHELNVSVDTLETELRTNSSLHRLDKVDHFLLTMEPKVLVADNVTQ